ncbi:glycosyltransferase family 4 protein [Haloarcula marina]|uniref:glycosyltransferase family 4 protein n=1 Tax=Haloarcula marina TaxID=2961574 RepID=UPI0020B6E8EA|nr:glycosyltransferase family 1 protein [Halomicroarcula marina]
MSIRVGIDARFLGRTGIGRYVKNLLQSLPTVVNVVAFVTSETIATAERARPSAETRRVYADPFSPLEQMTLPAQLYRSRIDCFHATQFNIPLIWTGPLVTTIHDCAYDHFPSEFGDRGPLARQYYRSMMARAVRQSDTVVAVSESTKRDLASFYDADPDDVQTVYEGVSPSEFGNSTGQPATVNGAYLLYVGSNRPRKNIENLLQGVSIANEKRAEPIPLVMAGEYNDRFGDLKEVIHRWGLEAVVHRPGYVEDAELARLYAHATAFVFPSLYEGFGLPLLEAMAAGTPVIAADRASIPEVCGEAARYITPTDPNSIADGIIEVTSSERLRAELRRKGYNQVNRFDWATMGNRLSNIYYSAAGSDQGTCYDNDRQ